MRFTTLGCMLLALFTAPFAAYAQTYPVPVVASFSILSDMTQAIGGQHVAVHTLVGRNSDVHAYNATPKDVALVQKAQLVVMNGLHLEGWLERILKNDAKKTQVLVLAQAALPYGLTVRTVDNEQDPHLWNSPRNGMAMVKAINDSLKKIDAPNAAYYQQRTDAYVANLQKIDTWATSLLATVAPENKRLLCAHDSFGYLAAVYGLEFIAPVRLSTKDSPTARDIARVVQHAKTQRIKAAFLENSNDPRLVQQLSKDAGVAMGGTLYPESLSGEAEGASTYSTLLMHNIGTIARAVLPTSTLVTSPVLDAIPQ